MSFFTVDALVAHAVGDYVLQSHWMATEKVNRSSAAAIHAVCYTLPFLLLTRSPAALTVICLTHFVIDRWRLARYVVWVKNFLAPRQLLPTGQTTDESSSWISLIDARNYPWRFCQGTGYPADLDIGEFTPQPPPSWLAVWLMIIVDNLMHIICNGAALAWLT